MTNVVAFDQVLKHTERPFLDKPPAAPFVKWAGGKRSVMPSIAEHFPDEIGTYWEPFVGGGAVFFTMADRINQAILSDTNEELLITYNVVKSNVGELITLLKDHTLKHKRADYYNKVKKMKPTEELEIAGRFIYLNKTCFNGLYRVNKKGQFNVPKGKYKNPNICDEERLKAASKVLKKATIKIGDFNNVVSPNTGDFVYCDPPYDECFTSYQPGGFNDEDQKRLRDAAKQWIEDGASVMVSNSHTDLIKRLYAGKKFRTHVIKAPRHINSDGNGRGKVDEVIVTSYD